MDVDDDNQTSQELESREPTPDDLANLCRYLNAEHANYVVIGGFAIRAAGYIRQTMDIDLLIETGVENETRVFQALEHLPDKAVQELIPGEVGQYVVVRVADEIVVDLMQAACGITYHEAAQDLSWHEVGGVRIPFASPRLLWRMKNKTYRDKDKADLTFLRMLIERSGEQVPE